MFNTEASSFNPNTIERVYFNAAQKHNNLNPDLNFNSPNCWGTLLYITGLMDDLAYSDYAPVLGFFQSKHCQKINSPNRSGDFFTHIDGPDGALHSYYVGPDQNAWQKFDPSPYSLIVKEPHEKIMSWYQLLANFDGSKYQYTFYSCNQPKGSFTDILKVYKHRDSESIETILSLISSKLNEKKPDPGELILLLYTLESIVHQNKFYYGLSNMTEELRPYDTIVTDLLSKVIYLAKKEDQDLLNSVLSFYLNPKTLINILDKIIELGGPERISKTNLELIFRRISLFVNNDAHRSELYRSKTFNNFVSLITDLNSEEYSFLVKPFYLSLKEQSLTDPALLSWLEQIIEETTDSGVLHSTKHYILYHFHLQGVEVPFRFHTEPDEDTFFELQFNLAAGHYFPNSYSTGWEGDFH